MNNQDKVVLNEVKQLTPWTDNFLVAQAGSVQEISMATREVIAVHSAEYEYKETEYGCIKVKENEVYTEKDSKLIGYTHPEFQLHISNTNIYNYRVIEMGNNSKSSILEIYIQPLGNIVIQKKPEKPEKVEKKQKLGQKMLIEVDNEFTPLFSFSCDTIYFLRENILYRQELIIIHNEKKTKTENTLHLITTLPSSVEIRCMKQRDKYVALGMSDGALVFINLLSGIVQQTLWHSSSVKHLHVQGIFCVSVSVKGVCLMTNISTLKNTFIAAVNDPVQMIYQSLNGYLLIETQDSIIVIELSTKKVQYKAFKVDKVTPRAETKEVSSSSIKENILAKQIEESIQIEHTYSRPTPLYDTPSKNVILKNGIVYLLGRHLIFTSETNEVYRAHIEAVKIDAFSVHEDTLWILLSEPMNSDKEKPEVLSKRYKLGQNTTLLLEKTQGLPEKINWIK